MGQIDIIFQTQTAELRFIPTRVGQIRVSAAPLDKFARFIPTRVGQMAHVALPPTQPLSVHPHACGADVGDEGTALREASRFIPTRVGQMDAIPIY